MQEMPRAKVGDGDGGADGPFSVPLTHSYSTCPAEGCLHRGQNTGMVDDQVVSKLEDGPGNPRP